MQRLTLVDLQVDATIYTQYLLAKTVYLSYTDDFHFARLGKRLEYNPYVEGWREKREENPQVYRRQGFALGRLDNALDALVVNDEKGISRFMSFSQFEEKFDAIEEEDVNSSLGTARDMFFGFHPNTRPVLWRILIAQALLYRCILELSHRRDMTASEILAFITCLSPQEMGVVDWHSVDQ